MRRRVKFILTEIGKPFHIQVAGAWVLVFSGLFVYLSDAFVGFALPAAACAGVGVALIIQSDKLKTKQERRKKAVNTLEKRS